jgi:hypothetical protein
VSERVRKALEHCPRIKVVIHERLGTSLMSEDAYEAFRSDVQTLRTILDETPTPSEPRALHSSSAEPDLIDAAAASLASFQDAMLGIFLDQGAPHVPTWKSRTVDQWRAPRERGIASKRRGSRAGRADGDEEAGIASRRSAMIACVLCPREARTISATSRASR